MRYTHHGVGHPTTLREVTRHCISADLAASENDDEDWMSNHSGEDNGEKSIGGGDEDEEEDEDEEDDEDEEEDEEDGKEDAEDANTQEGINQEDSDEEEEEIYLFF